VWNSIMSWAEHVECVGESRVMYRVLLGKPDGEAGVGGGII
jgi:hypothetical protein